MIAQAKVRHVHWVLVVIFALSPVAVLAQEVPASQGQSPQDPDRRGLILPVPSDTPAENGDASGADREDSEAIPATRQQMRGLDEQVQEIKSDVLAIAAELSQLEEKLLYPSGTQVAIFVALAQNDTLRLDAVRLQIDGQLVAHYIYSFKELEALRKGGVQRIYVGNVASGEHQLDVLVDGALAGGEDFSGSEHFTFRKEVKPKLVELTVAGSGNAPVTLGEW